MRTQSALPPPLLLLLLLLSLSSLVIRRADARRKSGGYSDITDLNDPQVVDAGEFVVEEMNRILSQDATFLRVVAGEQKLADGIRYRLIVSEDGDGVTVWVDSEVYKKEPSDAWTLVYLFYLPDRTRGPRGAAADGGRPRLAGVPAR